MSLKRKRKRSRKKKEYVRTTVSLPYEVWESLRIESIKQRIPMGELIAKKLQECDELKKKQSIIGPNDLA